MGPKKAKNAPTNQHEKGLAAPGKRVTKKQSNGHLNGHPNGKPVPSTVPPSLPSAGIAPGCKGSRPTETGDAAPPTGIEDHVAPLEGTRNDRTYSDASQEGVNGYGEMEEYSLDHASPPPGADSLSAGPRSSAAAPSNGSFSSVSTILSYYPLRDAIAILILLLSLPPTLALVIQTLFASLTFVPPTAGISLSTLPNVKEMFNSSNMGYPALATILIVDLIFWVCWLPVWKPLQAIFLDLSQAVIAVSLSGAAATTGEPTYSIATSTAIVCIVHVLRYKAFHLTALDYLRSVIHKMDFGLQLDFPYFSFDFVTPPSVERGWLFTVTRTILGIHIVSQGVTTCIRRSLVKANEQSANMLVSARPDAEATTVPDTNPRSSNSLGESVQHATSATAGDSRLPASIPSHRDNRPRESNNKRKRKQANQVRSQQPLWAAIASTKVTFIKEMEQRDAADDAREVARMESNVNAAPSDHQNTDFFWICEVRDTEVSFSVELSTASTTHASNQVESGQTVTAGIDKSKPFFVRINGAAWSSTRIMASATDDGPSDNKGTMYDGEIFGLTPLSSYHCEIVCTSNHNVLSSASIITRPAPTAEQAASASTHQALRPSSPITTLRKSIQAAEAKLNEARNRSKRNKKEQRALHADVKREINLLRGKLDSSGGADDKQERRMNQIRQHKHQAEEAAVELKEQIDALGDIPEEEVAESEATRRRWQAASDIRNAANQDYENAKAEAERELNAMKAEITQAEARHERLAARASQRAQELEKLVNKQRADMTAKQKRDFDRAQVLQRREDEEGQFSVLIAGYESEMQSLHLKAQDNYQQIAAIQSWGAQPPPYPGYSSPPTPEHVFPATNGSIGSPQTNGFPTFGPHPYQSPFGPVQPSIPQPGQAGSRGRSSSMLSQYSGFTDNGAEDFVATRPDPRHQWSWPMQQIDSTNGHFLGADPERQGSDGGSGSLASGSTASSSPRPEAKTFVPGKTVAQTAGTIGPPSRNKEKAPHSPLQSSVHSAGVEW